MRKSFWFFVSLFISAQLSGQIKGGNLEEVVIVGQRPVKQMATTVTSIDSMMMKETSSETFASLLSKHSTIYVKTYGGGSAATVSFRGTAASHTQVEWNGVNVNNPMLGQVDFSLIPVWFVDKTDVYSGGSSLQEGSGALGGTVSMGSSVDWNKKLYGAVMQNVGSFGLYQTFVDVGGGSRKWQMRFRYMYDQAENDFEYLNRAIPPFEVVKQENADYKKQGGVIDVNYNAGKGNFLSLNLWLLSANRNLPTIMSYQGAGRTETQDDTDFRSVVRWNKYWGRFRSELTASFSATRVDYFLSNVTGLTTSYVNNDSRSEVNSVQGKYRLEYSPSERTTYRLLGDVAYHQVDVYDRKQSTGYAHDRVEAGLGLSAHRKFSDSVAGFVLLREDICDGRWTPIMPSVGVELGSFAGFTVKANVARNYHQPTLNDMYWSPGGNPDLRPEEGYTGDLTVGYDGRVGAFTFDADLTGYISDIDDWIMWRPSEFRYWTAENVRSVLSRGLEIKASVQMNYAGVKARVGGNYAYTRTTNEDSSSEGYGRQLIYIPEHKGAINADVAWKGFYAYYVWSAVSERYTTERAEATRHTLRGYDLHDVTVGKKWNVGKSCAMDTAIKVNNVGDRKYQSILWRAMPGRNFMVSVKFSYN